MNSSSTRVKRLSCVVAAIGITAALGACGSSSHASGTSAGSSGGSSGSTASGAPVTFALIDDFTGAAASVGVLDKEATQLYVNAVNSAGGVNGHKINLVTYDNKSDPALTTTLATRAISQDHAVVLACCATSDATAAAAAVAGSMHVPLITSAVEQSLTATNQPWYGYVFRAIPPNNALAQFNVDFIKSKNWSKVALDTTSLSYGTSAIPYFKQSIAAAGGTIVTQVALSATITDASVQAAQIIRAKPDVVLSWDYPNSVAQLVKALRAAGSNVPVVSNWSAINPAMASIAGNNVVNLYAHDTALPSKPEVQKFAQEWQSTYHNSAPITDQGIFGYGDAQVIAAAIKGANSETASGIKQALQAENCVPVIMGEDNACITYGAGNYEGAKAGNFLIMKTLQNGQWVPVS